MALSQLPPTDYDLACSQWPLHRLLVYLGARGLKALLDELDSAVAAFRTEIDRKT